MKENFHPMRSKLSKLITPHKRPPGFDMVAYECVAVDSACSLLLSRSGRSHVTLSVPTRRLQTDTHSFLGVLRFCLPGPMSLSFSCHCIRCTNHRREHSQENESHTLIGLFPRKECMSVWSSRVWTGNVTWLRPERLRRRLQCLRLRNSFCSHVLSFSEEKILAIG